MAAASTWVKSVPAPAAAVAATALDVCLTAVGLSWPLLLHGEVETAEAVGSALAGVLISLATDAACTAYERQGTHEDDLSGQRRHVVQL